jgi:hypothetical protein
VWWFRARRTAAVGRLRAWRVCDRFPGLLAVFSP